jgi:hypothetical protein
VGPPKTPSMMSGTFRMNGQYESRINVASEYTTFAFDGCALVPQKAQVHTSDEILAALRKKLDDRVLTQAEVARVLGVSQPNVTKLWSPAAKTGKTRVLGYDEGLKLVEAFELFDDGDVVSADALAPLLKAVVPLAPKTAELSDSAAQALAVALRHGLATLPNHGTIAPSENDLAGAARAAIARYREGALS